MQADKKDTRAVKAPLTEAELLAALLAYQGDHPELKAIADHARAIHARQESEARA